MLDNVIASTEIKMMNDIIRSAIVHGGDPGGPYYCNLENLVESVNQWLLWRGYSKDYGINPDGFGDCDVQFIVRRIGKENE